MASVSGIYGNIKKMVKEFSLNNDAVAKLSLKSEVAYTQSMVAMDLAIQMMLLKVSRTDGVIEFREMDTIKSVVEYADIFDKYGKEANWDKVIKKPKKLPEVLDKIEELYKKDTPYQFLVSFIACANVYYKSNFSQLIKSQLESLALAVSGIDGNADLAEIASGVQFIEIVWRKIDNKIKELKA